MVLLPFVLGLVVADVLPPTAVLLLPSGAVWVSRAPEVVAEGTDVMFVPEDWVCEGPTPDPTPVAPGPPAVPEPPAVPPVVPVNTVVAVVALEPVMVDPPGRPPDGPEFAPLDGTATPEPPLSDVVPDGDGAMTIGVVAIGLSEFCPGKMRIGSGLPNASQALVTSVNLLFRTKPAQDKRNARSRSP